MEGRRLLLQASQGHPSDIAQGLRRRAAAAASLMLANVAFTNSAAFGK
jgi:hypothetical protein